MPGRGFRFFDREVHYDPNLELSPFAQQLRVINHRRRANTEINPAHADVAAPARARAAVHPAAPVASRARTADPAHRSPSKVKHQDLVNHASCDAISDQPKRVDHIFDAPKTQDLFASTLSGNPARALRRHSEPTIPALDLDGRDEKHISTQRPR